MICAKCGTENGDNEMFCRECGTELFTGEHVSPDIPDKKRLKLKNNAKDKPRKLDLKKDPDEIDKKSSNVPENEKKTPAAKKGLFSAQTKIKLTVGGIAALALVVAIILISGNISAKKGERLANAVPIGRNMEFCMKETGEEFSATSKFKDMRSVSGFNYICESEKDVKISGITVPTWAVLVNEDSKNIISSVEYYNFAVLRDGWKGKYSSVLLTKESVTYGMDEKTVAKTVGTDPYYTKKTADNKTVRCYRYYIIDNETGNDRVFNYFVEFNDVNGTVVNAYDTEINYVNYILGIR